jgi:hypothetical protein
MFSNDQENISDGLSSNERNYVASRNPIMPKLNSTAQLHRRSAVEKSEDNFLVSSVHHRNTSLLEDQSEDDSMFILVPPQSLANEINTKDLLVSPTKYRGKIVCDRNAMNSLESAAHLPGLEPNVCLGSSSVLGDSGKENIVFSQEDMRNGGARYTFSHTPPRSNIWLPRRQCQLDWGQSTPSSISQSLLEDSELTTRGKGDDFATHYESTPREDLELPITSPPPLIRRLPCASPASLTRPLPIKMQLPSI